jgi:hypothetical protein
LETLNTIRIVVLATVLMLVLSVALDRSRDAYRHQTEPLMAGTVYETSLHVIDSGRTGHNVLVLAGVHGNEPGAWMAAEALLESGVHPETGKLLILPRANVLAVAAGIRSTPEIGDLNRLYFGDPGIFPMARMAAEIVDVIQRHRIDVVLDLHESWDFHDREATEVELSALGQTISPHLSEPSLSMAPQLVAAANARLPSDPAFQYHEFPAGHVDRLIVPLPPGVSEADVPRKSGMDLPERFPALASILVEVGQQQPLDRRIAQQIAVVEALIEIVEEQAHAPLVGPLG